MSVNTPHTRDKTKISFTITSNVWLYPAQHGAWHFVSIPKNTSTHIKEFTKTLPRRGWGSVRVHVTMGNTMWNTSIFPDGKTGTYILPLNARVRAKEGIAEGDAITFTIALVKNAS